MTALEQKLQDYQLKLAQLKAEKAAAIEEKVAAFRAELESQQDHSDEQKICDVIDACQKIIAFDGEAVKPNPLAAFMSGVVKGE